MAISRIIFWQNVLSIHQSAFVRALAEHRDLEVWFAYEEDLPPSRTTMGWTIPDYGQAKVVDSRDPVVREELVSMGDRATVHVFGSYFVLPEAYAAFRRLRRTNSRLIWTTEAFQFRGWRGWIRTQRARWHALREARTAFEMVFVMGVLGMDFYRRAWIRPAQLREFGYSVELPASKAAGSDMLEEGATRLLFVGQLIARKGVDHLIDALATLSANNWRLDLIGDGIERTRLESLVNSRGLGNRVSFHGNQPNEYALDMIRQADALILPSRWDGWGAVVNESLMVGTPAVVSSCCGVASIIVDNLCGQVFPEGDSTALANMLEQRAKAGKVDRANRARLSRWANRRLSGAALADYFLACLNRDETQQALPQVAPWRLDCP